MTMRAPDLCGYQGPQPPRCGGYGPRLPISHVLGRDAILERSVMWSGVPSQNPFNCVLFSFKGEERCASPFRGRTRQNRLGSYGVVYRMWFLGRSFRRGGK